MYHRLRMCRALGLNNLLNHSPGICPPWFQGEASLYSRGNTTLPVAMVGGGPLGNLGGWKPLIKQLSCYFYKKLKINPQWVHFGFINSHLVHNCWVCPSSQRRIGVISSAGTEQMEAAPSRSHPQGAWARLTPCSPGQQQQAQPMSAFVCCRMWLHYLWERQRWRERAEALACSRSHCCTPIPRGRYTNTWGASDQGQLPSEMMHLSPLWGTRMQLCIFWTYAGKPRMFSASASLRNFTTEVY